MSKRCPDSLLANTMLNTTLVSNIACFSLKIGYLEHDMCLHFIFQSFFKDFSLFYLHMKFCMIGVEDWTSMLKVSSVYVLARILKMPVQNSNFKIFARPDLATHLFQILLPATFNNLMCQKGQFSLQVCPRR